MEEIVNHIKNRIDKEIRNHLDLPKVILLGETGAGKTQLLFTLADINPNNSPISAEPFNFLVEPLQRFTLWDFTSIINEHKKEIIMSIIDYLFQKSPNSENKVTVLLAVPESDIDRGCKSLIQNIKNAQNMFGKHCQLTSKFGIVLTKCTDDPETVYDNFFDILDNLPSSLIDDTKDYFEHLFILPYMDEEMDDFSSFEDKQRIIDFIFDNYISRTNRRIQPRKDKNTSLEAKNADIDEKIAINLQSATLRIDNVASSLQNILENLDQIISDDLIHEKPTVICKSCKNPVETDICVYYSGQPYHKECVKCSYPNCNKVLDENEKIDDFICTTPGFFLCTDHYNEQMSTETPNNEEFIAEYTQKMKENIVDEVFDNPLLTNEDTSNYAPEEVLVTQEMAEEAIEKKPFEDFIPTMKLEFDKPADEIDLDKLPDVLGDDVAILDIEKKISNSIIRIALLSCEDFEPEKVLEEHKNYVNQLRKNLSSMGNRSVIGSLVKEPEVIIPEDQTVNKIINKPSINQFQNKVELTRNEIKEIQKEIIVKLKNKKGNENWKFIFSHEDLYNELEAQLHKDLEDNPYEMIKIGQVIIASKHFDEYGEIKAKIPPEKIHESFFYHGTKLNNHPKIAQTHFLMPGKNEMKQTDPGFYGQGIYATDNIFYASYYGNGTSVLPINQKTSILSCRAIYNKDKVKDLYQKVNISTELKYYGKPVDDDIKDDFGVNQVLVGNGDANLFFPIQPNEINKNTICGIEYVFPNEYQFIPCLSFTVLRKDHYILWKDDHIDNNENSAYLKELSKNMEINVYPKNTVRSALELIRKKKYSALKLITNAGGDQKTGRDLIKQARKIIGSNFVCLVFACDLDHMEWISKMENVLFTTDKEDFYKFAALKMNINALLDFIKGLQKYEINGYKFKINEKELLHFKNCDHIRFYKSYYQNYAGNDDTSIWSKIRGRIKIPRFF